jgi:AbrB family looped-hinge helix DNA binding protein
MKVLLFKLMILKRKLGPKGQLLLPKTIREFLGIKPGDDILIEITENEVKIRSAVNPDQYLSKLYETSKKLKTKMDIEASIEEEYPYEAK